jgi:hypothetical protein
LETLVPVINAKSIKRKYPGSGCVMVPAYNIMQYFQLDGKRYMFADVVELAREWTSENNIKLPETGDATTFERQLVTTYLQARQEQMEKKSTNDGFIPTDIVDIIINGKVHTVDLNDLDTYYAFKDLYKLEGYLNKV